jgi:hypothetical protein
MKIYIIILVTIIFYSCHKNHDFEKNIIGLEKKWLYINSNRNIDSLKILNFTYYVNFKKNHTWSNFFISNGSKSFNDGYYDWSYNENDSVLIMGTEEKLKFRILKYTKDTIYLENNKKEKEFLINLTMFPR